VLIAVSVTVMDAMRAAHWRAVAHERRQAWLERGVEAAAPGGRPLSRR
jgi:hypothetical protein